MVQGIDNLTRIDGQIMARSQHPALADYDLLEVRIDAAAPVEGRADLLSQFVGQTLGFSARRDRLGIGWRPHPLPGQAHTRWRNVRAAP